MPEDPLGSCDADFMRGWEAECEAAAMNARRLLRLAGRGQSGAAVIELIRSVPLVPQRAGACPQNSYFHRCVVAVALGPNDPEVRAVIDYFKSVMAMPPSRRNLLEASLAGVVLGLGG